MLLCFVISKYPNIAVNRNHNGNLYKWCCLRFRAPRTHFMSLCEWSGRGESDSKSPTLIVTLTLTLPSAGRVGLWKDVFTVSMNDKFDTIYRQKMGKSDLTFDFGLWAAPVSPPSGLRRSTPDHLNPPLLFLQTLQSEPGFAAHERLLNLQPVWARGLMRRSWNLLSFRENHQYLNQIASSTAVYAEYWPGFDW